VVLVRAPQTRAKVSPRVWKWWCARATGDARGERLCGSLRGNSLSEARSRMTRGSVSESRNSSKRPYTRPVALCSPRLRLKSPEEIGIGSDGSAEPGCRAGGMNGFRQCWLVCLFVG